MHFDDFIKHEKQELRRLADLAYKAEMSIEMEKLAHHFADWRAGNIDVFALDERVHNYHDGAHRELYKRYVMYPQYHLEVARALVLKLIPAIAISQDLMAKIKPLIESIDTGE